MSYPFAIMRTLAAIFLLSPNRSRWTNFLLLATFLAGVGLRLWRLDLMPFRYDAAEALFRARETFSLGHPPLTGIVNSLGFRNPPGLQWIILPAVLLSPDPRVAAAWIGLLVASGIFPLFWLGRRTGSHAVGYGAALLYAFHPQTVFSSRDVWAQHLLIPLGAWALLFAVIAAEHWQRRSGTQLREDCQKIRPPFFPPLVVATALAAAASLVHLASATWLAALGGCAGWQFWRARHLGPTLRHFALFIVILGLFVLSASPSLIDWMRIRSSPPAEKPPHIAKFELLAPAPKPLPGRLGEAYTGIFDPLASVQVLGGIEKHLPPAWFSAGRGADLVLLVFALLGLARLLLACGRRTPIFPVKECSPVVGWLLSAWILLPPAFVGLLMRYPNATYLYFAVGAVFLCTALGAQWLVTGTTFLFTKLMGALPRQSHYRRLADNLVAALFFLLAILHGLLFVEAMDTVERIRVVNGPYYTPLKEQLGLVREFDRVGIGRRHLLHLGGPWFQRSYDYLLDEVLQVPPRPHAVVMEDLLLRRSQPLRQNFVIQSLDRQWGTIRWGVFPTWEEATRLADEFYRLPPR
ncbi:MAG: glycosyltransferase family 39 protein [Candidatus Sumerlaeaceae bacterium]|nr:glycosyltransferase family 39 protein [Candidatus Sumerlaeaceae bacterium]